MNLILNIFRTLKNRHFEIKNYLFKKPLRLFLISRTQEPIIFLEAQVKLINFYLDQTQFMNQ